MCIGGLSRYYEKNISVYYIINNNGNKGQYTYFKRNHLFINIINASYSLKLKLIYILTYLHKLLIVIINFT